MGHIELKRRGALGQTTVRWFRHHSRASLGRV